MRLADLDKLKNEGYNLHKKEVLPYRVTRDVYVDLDDMPIDYDVSKVVERLEEHKRVARDGVQSYDCVPLNKAISIVEGGGLDECD